MTLITESVPSKVPVTIRNLLSLICYTCFELTSVSTYSKILRVILLLLVTQSLLYIRFIFYRNRILKSFFQHFAISFDLWN